jgi:hypothetical protein
MVGGSVTDPIYPDGPYWDELNVGRGVHFKNLTRLVSILVYIDENPSLVGGEHRMYALKRYEPIVELNDSE